MRAFAWASAAVLALSSAPGAGAAPDEAYARKPPKYTGEQYPQGALRCESTMTRPGYELICPEDRNEWCVKEVVTLEQENCGRSAYFGDMWDPVEKVRAAARASFPFSHDSPCVFLPAGVHL